MEEDIREIIQRELPALVMKDPQIRDWVWHLIHDYAPSRSETESRFEQMLSELHAMREEFQQEMRTMREEFQKEMRTLREESEHRWAENQRRWEENERRWKENQRRWEENERKWKENQRRWEENERKWKENQRRWEENERRWEENQRRWEENQRVIREILERIDRVDHRIDRTIGALGARWGASSETTFRNALKAILEKSFGVKVERVEYHDDSGEVFGYPDQVELDMIIRNGELLVCEIKSSASRADIYTFERKVRSYEKRTQRKANRLLLISPMVKEKDQELARALGMEVYSDAEEVIP